MARRKRLGRWNSIQLVNPQDLNRYAYVANNPLRYYDPDGKEKIEIIIRTFIPDSFKIFPLPIMGDGRNVGDKGTFRTEQRITIETDPNKRRFPLVHFKNSTGKSFGFGFNSLLGPMLKPGQANGDSMEGTIKRDKDAGVVNINTKVSETYPNAPSPAIDYNFNITVKDQDGTGNGRYRRSARRLPRL